MSYTISDKFSEFKIDPSTEESGHVWDNAERYKSSYFQQSAKNQLALKNSTEHLNKTKSNNLKSISSRNEFHTKKLDNIDFVNYDQRHRYRTTYTDMSTSEPKLLNGYYMSRYSGFVPGMNSENPFGSTFQNLAKEQIDKFDNRRYGRETTEEYKSWKYNPISKSIGSFWNPKYKRFHDSYQSTLSNHDCTSSLRESGFSSNLYPTNLNSAWLHPAFNSDQVRTEYRIQYSTKKDFHFTEPTYSSGTLRKKEKNYKHT